MPSYADHDPMLTAFLRAKPPAEFYNTDCGHKKTIGSALAECPNRMSIMRSGTQRFCKGSKSKGTPFGMYQTDTAFKKSLASSVRDSRRFYASSFDSGPVDRQSGPRSSAPDLLYDVQTLSDGMPATLHTSKQAKAAPGRASAAPDVEYDVDALSKATLATQSAQSPLLYACMGRSSTQRSPYARATACSRSLGPGAYTFPVPQDMRVSLVLKQGPLSSMASGASRLATDKADPTKNLGSTWRPDHDLVHWKRGVTISKAAYKRPSYLPRA